MTTHEPRPRIAIVGSGISGLAAAWLLGDRFDVTLFERRQTLGLGAEGFDVETENGSARVDIPPRVFNAGHYQALTKLLVDAGMPTYEIAQRPTFTDERGRPYLSIDTAGQGDQTRNRLRAHPRTWRWLARHGGQLYRWHRFLSSFDAKQIDADETLGDALARLGFSAAFRDSFLYPMWTLMCTCRYDQLDAFPARPVLELARNFAGNFATRRLEGGTRALEARLQQRVRTTKLGRTVSAIDQRGDQVMVRTLEDADPDLFSHVILATDPRSTERLLEGGPWGEERSLIARVPLHKTCMTLHTDATTLPASLQSPVNIHVNAARRQSSATLWMNPIENRRLTHTVLQSWDPLVAPADETILAQRTFYRAIMNMDSQRAMSKLRENLKTDASRRVWFVGSYVGAGVPLLENGVQSAGLVAGILLDRFERSGLAPAARIA